MELVRRAQSGDREALERVLERYYDRVRRAVSIKMGPRVRTWTDSVDIMTRTFLKALEKFDSFEMRSDGALQSWLVTIACGMIRDAADERNAAMRDPDRETPIVVSNADGTTGELPLADPARRIVTDLGVREDGEAVDRAIANLAESDRELLLQYYFYDMSWEEIASRSGDLPTGADRKKREQAADAVRKRAMAARARLAIELQRQRGPAGPRDPEP